MRQLLGMVRLGIPGVCSRLLDFSTALPLQTGGFMVTTEPSSSTLRWQYQTLRFENGREFEEAAEQTLNQFGAEGWEVAGFARFEIGRENGYRVILKRPY